ncbi:MAG: hypothetical protein QW331_02910 [Candidatus Woesearchaeota archaeon]
MSGGDLEAVLEIQQQIELHKRNKNVLETIAQEAYELIVEPIKEVIDYFKSFYESVVETVKNYFNLLKNEEVYSVYRDNEEVEKQKIECEEQEMVREASGDVIFKTNNQSYDKKRKFIDKLAFMGASAHGWLLFQGKVNGMLAADADYKLF